MCSSFLHQCVRALKLILIVLKVRFVSYAGGMWEPHPPIVRHGITLTPRAAWVHLFRQEWVRLAEGLADDESVLEVAAELYEKEGERDPVEVALELFGPGR